MYFFLIQIFVSIPRKNVILMLYWDKSLISDVTFGPLLKTNEGFDMLSEHKKLTSTESYATLYMQNIIQIE